jgi:hypothetical protein
MTNATVSLTIQLTPDEVYRASVRVMLRKMRIFIFIGVIFLLVMGGVYVAHPSTPQQLLVSIAPFFYLMFAFCVAVFVVPYFSTRASFKKDDQQPTVLTFSDDGISIQSSEGKSHADWDVIHQLTETERDFLIGVSEKSFWTIPKRTIPDESTLITLRKLFQSHVQGRLTLFAENV